MHIIQKSYYIFCKCLFYFAISMIALHLGIQTVLPPYEKEFSTQLRCYVGAIPALGEFVEIPGMVSDHFGTPPAYVPSVLCPEKRELTNWLNLPTSIVVTSTFLFLTMNFTFYSVIYLFLAFSAVLFPFWEFKKLREIKK